MDADPTLTERLVTIESTLMHLARDLETMHQGVLAQRREIDQLRRMIERCHAALERDDRGSSDLEIRDPAAEKPPHY
jgi:uncharacterized coiled-coil protein SlyX